MKAKDISSSKKIVASTAKKKPATPRKKKPAVTAKDDIDASNALMHFIIGDSFKGKRIAYLILDAGRSTEGAFLVHVAVKGDGVYKTEWGLDCTYSKALERAKEMNAELGLTDADVSNIIGSTVSLLTRRESNHLDSDSKLRRIFRFAKHHKD